MSVNVSMSRLNYVGDAARPKYNTDDINLFISPPDANVQEVIETIVRSYIDGDRLDQHTWNGSSTWLSVNLPLTCDFTKVANCIFDHFDKDADNKNVNVTFSGMFKWR